MRKAFSVVVSVLLFAAKAAWAESTWEFSVQVSAAVQQSPAQITLSWPQDSYMQPNSYTVYRKAPGDNAWGQGTTLPGTATSFIDRNVTPGIGYEYQIVKSTSQYTGYGYIYSGINLPLVENRGTMLLVVDNTIAGGLSSELARLQQDLVGDGWTANRMDVSRTDSAQSVKDQIKAKYAADPANVKAVFLFGHVPVPYSGNIVPDGHVPDHQGAWPCDAFYGDMDGTWTDNAVNNASASDARNRNVPGDGKFDQSTFPAAIRLMVGRVDLANMPGRLTWGGPATFPSETELLRNYLNKDHKFRQKQFDLPRRAYIADFFGNRGGEAFVASGWRNFSSFFSATNLTNLPDQGSWVTTLASNPALTSYGCGAGSYTSIGGLGNSDSYHDVVTTEIMSNDVKTVFALLFGSWLGDWDSEDNILRSILALPSYGLASAWSGRPHWFLQHMAMGEPIGFGARLTQNNPPGGLYQNQLNSAAGQIHIALMGDPSLRLHVVAPPGAVTSSGGSVQWTASPDQVIGYHVYRASNPNGPFTRVTAGPVTGTSFSDTTGGAGQTYMVRAIKLETSGSGTYYNASQGAFANAGTLGGTTGGSNTNVTSGGSSNTNSTTTTSGVTGNVWVDDVLPSAAVQGSDGGDGWSWVSSNPAPVSGRLAHQSSIGTGQHQHYFSGCDQPMNVKTGDSLFAYVYLDPNSVPSELMLQWNDGTWEHRAYWGANYINFGTDGTPGRQYMGAMPAAGQWTRLEVPASTVGLAGSAVNGMAFSLYNGRATWDAAGVSSLSGTTPGNTNSVPSGTNSTGGTTITITNRQVWVEDSLPTAAVAGANGGDAWTWVNANPTPYSGSLANQSSVAVGLHEHFFSWTTQTLQVNSGDTLFAYVYIDPANSPSELMLQWNDGSWEHRAFWGSDSISYGSAGTEGHRYMGPMPAAGQWVKLEVPAATVGLEGKALQGMAFSLFDGRVTWDAAGKSWTSTATTPPTTPPPGGGSTTTTNQTSVTKTVWVDDALPTGAVPGSDGGDTWSWSANPAPFSGNTAHQSSPSPGLHQHYFTWATATLSVNSGDVMFAYVYLDPANMPTEVMLQWNDGTWDHRAYWGADKINYGVNGTPNRVYMGPLPAAGQWVCLQVPASKVNLEGSTLNGMAFSVNDGGASWDYTGKASGLLSITNTPGGGTSTNTPPVTTTNVTDVSWVNDALPASALPGNDGGDSWNWISSSPAPQSGSLAHQSNIGAGLHQHYFTWASQTLTVNTGDVLYAYVYLDPANKPSELMLQWNDGSWEHRAYWGSDLIDYGTPETAGRRLVGALPAAGQWVRLQVAASQVGLEGSTLNGMSFSVYNGRASWDNAGKATLSVNTTPGSTNTVPGVTNTVPDLTNSVPTVTNTPSGTNGGGSLSTNVVPGISVLDGLTPQISDIGSNALRVLTPTLLELVLVNTKQPDPAQVSSWNLVDSNSRFVAPPLGAFAVTANGSPVSVATVGFKRVPLYAPLAGYDLRIGNYLYLKLAAPIAENQLVEVKNPDGTLWTSGMKFVASADPLRYSPAIHVNQEGYMPNYSKKAMVGYYAGDMGEMVIPTSGGFKIVDANTGKQVFQGSLTSRLDQGYTYSPTPYQKVYEADFTSFNTPGEYRLVVPGLGGSVAFLINDGVAMSFARAYALGLYHQRCGTNMGLPYTRFSHDVCHATPAAIPMPSSSYAFTWNTIAGYANTLNPNNPPQIAPALTSPDAQLFPFVKQGTVDVSGGHHDAGDYSKYTANSASLIHYLVFAADSLAGAGSLDNLGIPESGDGVSDLLQEAKWEADFLAKLQDDDGGFYFLVYPKEREYEGNVTPDHGDPQVVWPKTTSVTAASVAALAQCASSPAFKSAFPAAAASYLRKAQLGWKFLTDAVAKYGKNGAYQKITHYADDFADNDELAWAACEMFLATGDQASHQLLQAWFDPADPATWRWGWWHMAQCFGHAIRSYAFAARSGRVASESALNSTFLSKCKAEITAAAEDVLKFSDRNAYGTSFPLETKAVKTAGWYFSLDQAFDLAVGYQLNQKADYIKAIVANMNYEGGCNPVNVTFVTGLGWKRQRDIVSQWALNDTRVLPPSGIPIGNVFASFGWLWNYGGQLQALCYPSFSTATAPFPMYDRWGDSWNVSAEMVVLNQARGLGTLAFLAAQGPYKTQAWKAVAGKLTVPSSVVPIGSNITVTLQAPGLDLSAARITWEARDQEPAYGSTFSFTPKNNGTQWVEAEAQLPDGRRIFAAANLNADAPDIIWVDDAVPAGGATGSDGGDSWNWVTSNPAPHSGTLSHQSTAVGGPHQHYFVGATSTLQIGTGDVLYAWVYLDPANPPTEIMLQWNDGTWEHRAYWGANVLGYGVDGTPGRRSMGALPPAGQWVQLKVPASLVNLEGRTVNGMAFSLNDGRVSWDAAGRFSQEGASASNSVTVSVTNAEASRLSSTAGEFTFTRTGSTNAPLLIDYSLAGDAVAGLDYQAPQPVRIPAGASSAKLQILPLATTNFVASRSVVLSVNSSSNYIVGNSVTATVAVGGNTVRGALAMTPQGPTMTWDSMTNRKYRVAYKADLNEPLWTPLGDVTAQGQTSSWTDNNAAAARRRFYLVAQVD